MLISKFRLPLLHILAGVIYALNFPFIGQFTIFPSIFLSAAVLFYGLEKENRFKFNLLNIFLFCWGYNLAGYYWLTFTLNDFGGLFFPLNFIVWQIFSIFIAPQFYVFLVIYFFLKKKIKLNSFIGGVLYSAIFVLLEYIVPQQFPAQFGHTWLKVAPYLKPAQYMGVPFYSFLTLLIGFVIYRSFSTKKLPKFEAVIAVVLIIFNFSMGAIKSDIGNDLKIRMVQGNIGNDLKLKSEQGVKLASSEVVNIYKELSLRDGIEDIDLVIWPETSYPRFLFTKKYQKLPAELSGLFNGSKEKDTHFFIGTYDLATSDLDVVENTYNATALANSNGDIEQVYHKQVLIPFGEGLPFGSLNQYIAPYLKSVSLFAKGEKFTNFKVKNRSFISLICYEVLFPRYVSEYINDVEKRGEKVDFIVNVTNDSWYGPYSEQEQHLFLAKWRAIEFGIPLVRATNTGISVIVRPDGSEIKRSGNFTQEILDFAL